MKRLFRKCGKAVILVSITIKAVFIYRIFGIDHLSNYINRLPKQVVGNLLARFGAKIGKKVNISAGIIIDNAVTENYTHLIIGDSSYIGRSVFFDLVEPVTIGDECVISAKVTFLTHSDPGERLLKRYFERKTGKISVGKGAWIGVCATIMPGVTIGECAVIGANALVHETIAPYSVAVGVPAKVIRKINR